MNWQDFGQHLRNEKPGPAYWIHGDDSYFVGQAVSRLRDALGGEEETETGRFSAVKEIPEAVAWAKTYTIFSTHRLAIVDKAQHLDSASGEILAKYLAAPPSFATLVFLPDLDDKGTMPRWAVGKIRKVELKSDPGEIRRWIQAWLERQQVRVSGSVVNLLAERSGGKFGSILPDLEKVLLYVGPKGSMDLKTAEDLIIDRSEEIVFRTLSAVRKGRMGDAVESVELLLAQGTSGSAILALLSRAVKTSWALGLPESERRASAEMAGLLGVSSSWVERAKRYGEEVPRASARRAWEVLREADQRLKTSAHCQSMVMLRAIKDLVVAFAEAT
jgi:DNA polymerase-3 subunit delta